MSLFSRDPILLTPGPLTTSLATKTAMLRDWGSWDAAFNAVTAEVRRKLLAIVHAENSHAETFDVAGPHRQGRRRAFTPPRQHAIDT